MIKKICLFIFTFSNLLGNSQQLILEKNIHFAGRYLLQDLSKNKDSLILESEKMIQQVDIFNEDFMKSISINHYDTKIDISTLPIGQYLIQVRLGKRRIIMRLLKNAQAISASGIKLTSQENLNDIKDVDPTLKLSETNRQKQHILKPDVSYWVVYKSKSALGSHQTMSLERRDAVLEMITRNKTELKTEVGKNNTLLVLEVYDTKKFMRKQLRNSTYFKSKNSKIFNTQPLYTTKKSP